MTSSNGNIFRVTGHLCGEFTGLRWIPRTKASDAELSCFLWSAPEINGWVNNGEAGELRRHRAHYDVTAMRPWHHDYLGDNWLSHLFANWAKCKMSISSTPVAWSPIFKVFRVYSDGPAAFKRNKISKYLKWSNLLINIKWSVLLMIMRGGHVDMSSRSIVVDIRWVKEYSLAWNDSHSTLSNTGIYYLFLPGKLTCYYTHVLVLFRIKLSHLYRKANFRRASNPN